MKPPITDSPRNGQPPYNGLKSWHRLLLPYICGNNHNLCQHYDATEFHTLAHYMENHYNYFKSYETYVFHPGQHTPLGTGTLNITNVTKLTFTGMIGVANPAIINCNGSDTAFEFKYSFNITIKYLTFSECTRKHSTENGLAILAFIEGNHLSLLEVTVLISVDESFYIKDIFGEVTLSNLKAAGANTAGIQRKNAGNMIIYRYCDKLNRFKLSQLLITNSIFSNNSVYFDRNLHHSSQLHASGLSIDLECPNIQVKIDNVTLSNNSGNTGGNIAFLFYSFQTYFNISVEIYNSIIESGFAPEGGGGMYAEFVVRSPKTNEGVSCLEKSKHHRLLHIYNTSFINNTVEYAGSGVYLRQKQSLSLCLREEITFVNVTFRNNSVMKTGFGGIAFHSINFMITDYLYHGNPQYFVVLDSCSVHDNYAISLEEDGSGTGVKFTKSNHYFLLNNTAIFNNKVTGIVGMSSNIILSRNITIVNNTGSSGGGLLLCQNAVMYLDAYTNVTIAHNTANHTGGGICVDTDYLESKPICFFQLGSVPQRKQSLAKTINITVYDNNAGYAGQNIFGGSIDYCYIIDSPKHQVIHSTTLYNALFTTPNNTDCFSSVASPPRRACLCHNRKPNCTRTSHHSRQVYPGESFSLEVVLVGQHNGTVPGTVQATLSHKSSAFGERESAQTTNLSCTLLQYTIYTNQSHEVLQLGVQHTGEISGFEQSHQNNRYCIHISMKECPLGFAHSVKADNSSMHCDCDKLFSLHKEHINCNIKQQIIRRVPPVWIGYIETDKGSKTTAYHSHCPKDYCVNADVNLTATNSSLSQDEQCMFSRTGVLCGSCSAGLSNVLGSSECHSCSNYWLLLSIPFALAGILMVILLTLLNITIAEGTLSGIIFYCNIIENNISIFFPEKEIVFVTKILKMFLSLINLEIEVSLCLFNGMDAYIKAWLKFGFPLYLWFMTGVFIYISGKGRCSWIVKQNAVKVLATLILLSYARLLTAVTNALQVSYVHLCNGSFERRWMIDGNIEYFTGKHIPLVLFASFFSLLLLPFALSLLFIQCLQKVSHLKAFSWVNYFKPIFDAYTGPFKSSARFWTGLLLLLRGILFVVSASNTSGDPGIILCSIVLTVLMLLTISWVLPSSLYRCKCVSILECSSLLNLGVLASLLLIATKESLSSLILTHISLSIALFTFIGIIIYHIGNLQIVQKVCRKIKVLQFHRYTGMNKCTSLAYKNKLVTATFPNYEPYSEDREPPLADHND